jgi:hypothetical protein
MRLNATCATQRSSWKWRAIIARRDWKVTKTSDNSGIFVRFPAPDEDPRVAINEGYEIQIDDEGAPDGDMIHKTGAVYGMQPPAGLASRPPGNWNTFVIRVEGQIYNVTLNGDRVITNFEGNRRVRGYVGLQNHSPKDHAFFRNIVATPLSQGERSASISIKPQLRGFFFFSPSRE